MQVGSRVLVTLRHYFSLFDRIRIVLGSILVKPPMKVIFEKQNSLFANMKSYLDTPLRFVHVVLIASEDV